MANVKNRRTVRGVRRKGKAKVKDRRTAYGAREKQKTVNSYQLPVIDGEHPVAGGDNRGSIKRFQGVEMTDRFKAQGSSCMIKSGW
jgi:hypothetical protein